MDIDYSRPSSSQLVRDWNEFKKDKYKLLTSNFPVYRPPEPVAYRKLNCKYNILIKIGFLEKNIVLVTAKSDTDIYQLVLREKLKKTG